MYCLTRLGLFKYISNLYECFVTPKILLSTLKQYYGGISSFIISAQSSDKT